MLRPPLPAEVGLLHGGSRTTSSGVPSAMSLPKFIAQHVVTGVDHHLHVVLDEQLAEPSPRSRCSSAEISRRSAWFMPAVGSSSSSSRGSHRERPGDLHPALRAVRQLAGAEVLLQPGQPVRSIASRHRRGALRAAAAGSRPRSASPCAAGRAPSWMFSRTVRSGSSRTVWKVRATRRRATPDGGARWYASPSKQQFAAGQRRQPGDRAEQRALARSRSGPMMP